MRLQRFLSFFLYLFPRVLSFRYLRLGVTKTQTPKTLGILLEKLGGGVQPASQNPYPIYDQDLQYSLPYLWPDQKFETLFMTWLLNQNPVSNQRYNKSPSSNQC